MEKVNQVTLKQILSLPKTPGVYFFYGSTSLPRVKNEIIYIGKAINISDRVKNHFQQPSYRDTLFIDKVTKIGLIETGSEIEALILEANLIKKYQPKFNVVWRDDKNYFYVAVAINNNKMPYVYITHQPRNETWNMPARQSFGAGGKHGTKRIKTEYVGPFVEGTALKKTLKFLRRVFPFYTSLRHPKTKCTWCHLNLCPGPEPDLQEYWKNIKKLILILKGKRKSVLNSLKKEMQALSKESKFEEAGKVRDKMHALEQVMAHAKVINQDQISEKQWEATQDSLRELLDIKGAIERIECYDISNIQGKSATGSMVVFFKGRPDKSQYKKFRIRMKQEPNDIAMLKEVLTRRFNHPEWKYPEVILIDGGKAQLNVAITARDKRKAISDLSAQAGKKQATRSFIKVISIAKGRQELFIENKKQPIPLKNLPQEIYNLIKYLDDEAHRFAITYHKKLRRKALLK